MEDNKQILSGYLKKINLISGFILVFALPFYKPALPILSFLWVFTWLIDGGPIRLSKNFSKNKFLWLFLSLFLLYLLGMLFTNNVEDGWFNLEVKLSLFFFPLIICSLNNLYQDKFNKILWTFVFANLFAAVICLSNAGLNHFLWNFDSFFYSSLSVFHHPTYFSMYIAFSILVVLDSLHEKEKNFLPIWASILIIVFFMFVVFLLSSKSGIITSFLVSAGYLTLSLFSRKRYLGSILLIVFAALLFIAAINYNERFMAINKVVKTENIDKNDEDSNVARLMIWDSALQVGMENFLFGVGTGDTKDVLMEKYMEKGLFNPFEKKYNAHNEFLEIFVSLGIIGLLLFLYLLVFPAWLAFRNKDFVPLFFLLIVGLNFCFESMLSTIAGALFFSFFYSLLVLRKKDKFVN